MAASSPLTWPSDLSASGGAQLSASDDAAQHDQRQRHQVGQQPLVEVGRQQHEQRRAVDAEHGQVARLAPARHQAGRRRRRRRAARPASASRASAAL